MAKTPHTISEFLGANEWDDRPFIVMPYLKNGNARDFIKNHPGCNRLRIVCNYVTAHCHISDKSNEDSSRRLGTFIPSCTKDCTW